VLATVKDNVPRTTPVDFFSDGLTIWIAGEPGFKIRNIRSNPRVAVGVYHPMDHSKLNRSLQVQGKAKLINLRYHRKEFMMRVKKFGILSTLEKIAGERVQAGDLSSAGRKEWVGKTLNRFNLIRIDPDEITFLYIHPTRGMEKGVWEKSEGEKGK
jgi:nitroimidazol reductase NimA-like FMN-containing flavoprotein (pyridoxamine 5'-phosphate oxidase superfamily)